MKTVDIEHALKKMTRLNVKKGSKTFRLLRPGEEDDPSLAEKKRKEQKARAQERKREKKFAELRAMLIERYLAGSDDGSVPGGKKDVRHFSFSFLMLNRL